MPHLSTTFFDDFHEMDLKSCGSSVQDAIWCMSDCVGIQLAKNKRKRPAETQVFLGVDVDVSNVQSQASMSFAPLRERCDVIVEALHGFADAGVIQPGEAARIFGKLQFLLGALYASRRVGRAACLPLVEAMSSNARKSLRDSAANTPIRHMAQFFDRILAAGNVPVREIVLGGVRLPPLRLWTDASYVKRKRLGRIGLVALDPVSGTKVYARCVINRFHEWMCEFTKSKEDVIGQLEALAPVAALLTLQPLLQGRRLLHFIDNTPALSALVHGYTSKPDLAILSNAYHLLVARNLTDVWLE